VHKTVLGVFPKINDSIISKGLLVICSNTARTIQVIVGNYISQKFGDRQPFVMLSDELIKMNIIYVFMELIIAICRILKFRSV
jgi:hypothetical protein